MTPVLVERGFYGTLFCDVCGGHFSRDDHKPGDPCPTCTAPFDGAEPIYKRRGPREIPDVQEPSIEYARKRGWLCQKMKSDSANGWPDFECIRAGRTVRVEFKKPGVPPTEQQLKRHREIREHGGEVFVIDNLETAKVLFK